MASAWLGLSLAAQTHDFCFIEKPELTLKGIGKPGEVLERAHMGGTYMVGWDAFSTYCTTDSYTIAWHNHCLC